MRKSELDGIKRHLKAEDSRFLASRSPFYQTVRMLARYYGAEELPAFGAAVAFPSISIAADMPAPVYKAPPPAAPSSGSATGRACSFSTSPPAAPPTEPAWPRAMCSSP